MANIKHLQMWKSICTNEHIDVCSTWFGLCTKVTYIPTGSVVEGRRMEISMEDGSRLKYALELPHDKLISAVSDFHPKEIPNGNYIVELCVSHDRQFCAVMLLQFVGMSYEPVSRIYICEGETAQFLSGIF